MALDLREMALIRLHAWLIDPLIANAEEEEIRHTTHLETLTIDSANRAHGVEYTATPALISRWIHNLRPGPADKWNFIDVGAGRGRVIAEAARHPYNVATGIEFASELAADARRHIAAIDPSKIQARTVDIQQADATTIDLEPGANFFFLFNPFDAPVVRQFIANTVEKVTANSRPLRIAYYNPVHAELFDRHPMFERAKLPLGLALLFALFSPFGLRVYDLR